MRSLRAVSSTKNFVASGNALFLDLVCKRYGFLPSRYVGIKDKIISLDFDIAIAMSGIGKQNADIKKQGANLSVGTALPENAEYIGDKLPSEYATPEMTMAGYANLKRVMAQVDKDRK